MNKKKGDSVLDSKANYFFCVRVTNPQVRASISDALDWILDKDGQYEEFCYISEMLHVTLCEVSFELSTENIIDTCRGKARNIYKNGMCLQTDEDIRRASQVLEESSDLLLEKLPNSKLHFRGLKTFFEKVLVADVQYESDFRLFCKVLVAKLKEAGVNVVERHEFHPHMTIMKVNTMRAKKSKVENINPWLYVNLKKTHFGDQRVNSVHLCKMGYERREDGFYKTPTELVFRTDEFREINEEHGI